MAKLDNSLPAQGVKNHRSPADVYSLIFVYNGLCFKLETKWLNTVTAD